ncbi:MAG: prepilin-type N-terminal cleavage/methylation domain-containing protein [Kiritimatiellae bacterium]|nr:prepilin-type N-terminal cleavage/methylation domain-containing protein [Kiritimatiellia bacterium]
MKPSTKTDRRAAAARSVLRVPASGGFTLVEVLVAAAVGALAVAGVGTALSYAFKGFASVAARGEKTAVRSAQFDAVMKLREDVACALPPPSARFAVNEKGLFLERMVSADLTDSGFLHASVSWTRGPDGGAVRTCRTHPGNPRVPETVSYPAEWGAPEMQAVHAADRLDGTVPAGVQVDWVGQTAFFRVKAGEYREDDESRSGASTPAAEDESP